MSASLRGVARGFADHPDAWPVAPIFDPVRRWYHRLHAPTSEAGAEVWLLTWLPGQGTELHDHGGSAGAFVVVSGVLTEDTVHSGRSNGLSTLRSVSLPAGAAREFGNHHVHRVINNGSVPAISVHAYAPRLTTMTRYDLVNGRLRELAVDRAGAQW